jgi:hypothetical protein
MEPLVAQSVGFVTSECYKATVNESETITDAQPAVGGPLGQPFRPGFQSGMSLSENHSSLFRIVLQRS